jgi:hypothetical protein
MLLHDELNIVTLLNGVKTSKNIVKGDILIGEEPLIVIGVEAKIYTSYNIISEWAEPMLLSDKNILYLYFYNSIKISFNKRRRRKKRL